MTISASHIIEENGETNHVPKDPSIISNQTDIGMYCNQENSIGILKGDYIGKENDDGNNAIINNKKEISDQENDRNWGETVESKYPRMNGATDSVSGDYKDAEGKIEETIRDREAPEIDLEAENREAKQTNIAEEVSMHEGSTGEEDSNNGASDSESNSGPDFNNKRIILQRFTIYNSLTTMYIVGSNAKESLYRILEISKDVDDEKVLTIIEDKNFFYTRKDMVELLNGLDESIEGGIHKIAQGYGLLGLIRFTKGYYLCIITKCSQVAILGGHYVYHIDETKLIPLDINYRRPEKYSDEERLLAIFKYLDLSKTFYFSYAYDITNSLQTNFIRNKKLATAHKTFPHPNTPDNLDSFKHNERFVWNSLLLQPISENSEVATYEWFQPIIHGFIDQASISVYGKKFYITIIARRSHHYAGARFLKRGVNDRGNVANEIETEQIVSDMLTSSFHDSRYGFYNNPRYTSFVQHRGSIPLYWTQDLNRLPKPPIEINLTDPFYQSSAIHFNNLFQRYGLPIIILNLIKTKEKTPRELKLNQHFISCINYLNQFLPEPHKLVFHSFDMSRHSKKNLDVIGPLQHIASESIKEIGFFHNGVDLPSTKLQKGIIRTNCIDCLDRTNAAQFIICKEALSHQLKSLNLIHNKKSLDYDSDLINILTEIFHDHGDTIAVQYGGSNLVNTMDSYRRINQWSSHTRDVLNSVKRIYSNSFMDLIRQEAINLFLGNYIYDSHKPKLWELQNDFYLHNAMEIENIRVKRSYTHWFNNKCLDNLRYQTREIMTNSHNIDISGTQSRTEPPFPDNNDHWFNECYVPKKFQSLTELFQYNMNSNARYFPSNIIIDGSKPFDYSPFESRKSRHEELQLSIRSANPEVVGLKHGRVQDGTSAETPEPEGNVSIHATKKSGHDQTFGVNDVLGQNYLTNPKRIKRFLANKIEKFGYTGKASNEHKTYHENDITPKSTRLTISMNSFYEPMDDISFRHVIKDSDLKLYASQWELPTLNANILEIESRTLEEVNPESDSNDTYRYYTSQVLNRENVEHLLDGFKSKWEMPSSNNSEDIKLYIQYLGLDEDRVFDFSAENDYFN